MPHSTLALCLLGAIEIVASADIAKAAGVALSRIEDVGSKLTIDAMVMATAALSDAIVVASDPRDFEKLASHFPGVVVLST